LAPLVPLIRFGPSFQITVRALVPPAVNLELSAVPPLDKLVLLGVTELRADDGVQGSALLRLLLLLGGSALLGLHLVQQALEQLLLLTVEVGSLSGLLAVLQREGKKTEVRNRMSARQLLSMLESGKPLALQACQSISVLRRPSLALWRSRDKPAELSSI
jgi:hypothetical protein